MAVAFEDYMSAAAAVATVGASFGYVFGPVEVARACAALAAPAEDLNVIYKVGFSHEVSELKFLYS